MKIKQYFLKFYFSWHNLKKYTYADSYAIKNSNNFLITIDYGGPSTEHPAQDRTARARGSLGEASPCALMAPGACKIRCGCIILQVPILITPLGVPKQGSHPLGG